jgi:hypothetical protein
MANQPVIRIHREGNTSKPDPLTIVIVANPALEVPIGSGTFIVDPIVNQQAAFDATAAYTVDCLFGDLPGQVEKLLGHPDIRDEVRVVSLFATGLNDEDASSLVAEDDPLQSSQIIARRTQLRPFLNRFGLDADIAFALSASPTHNVSTAFATSDDDARGGVPFVVNGVTLYHRFFARIPGAVALHVEERDLTPLHELQHALGSYTNGQILDLYEPRGSGINKRQGRPIPAVFSTYDGSPHATDLVRDGLGYGANWRSYHCELHAPGFPAVMDDYFRAPKPPGPLACENDTITRQFLLDRLRAKITR